MNLLVPARVSDEQLARAQELAVNAFVATDCEGMARVDLFVRDDGEVLVNELNTIPGFTATSVYAQLFAAVGRSVRRAARATGRPGRRALRAPRPTAVLRQRTGARERAARSVTKLPFGPRRGETCLAAAAITNCLELCLARCEGFDRSGRGWFGRAVGDCSSPGCADGPGPAGCHEVRLRIRVAAQVDVETGSLGAGDLDDAGVVEARTEAHDPEQVVAMRAARQVEDGACCGRLGGRDDIGERVRGRARLDAGDEAGRARDDRDPVERSAPGRRRGRARRPACRGSAHPGSSRSANRCSPGCRSPAAPGRCARRSCRPGRTPSSRAGARTSTRPAVTSRSSGSDQVDADRRREHETRQDRAQLPRRAGSPRRDAAAPR